MNSIVYMKDMICTNPFVDPSDRRKKTKAKFEEQLKRYKPVMTTPKDPQSTPKMTVSGKTDKEGRISGMFKDDLITNFALNMYLWDLLLTRKVQNFNYQMVFAPAV